MPSPIDLLLDPVSLAILALYGALIAWEALAPARQLPVAYWGFLGSGFAVMLLLAALAF